MTGHCTAVLSSTTRETPAYRALDVDGIGSWVEATLEDLASCDALWRRARACRPPRWFIAGCTIRMRRLSRSTGFTEIAALESTVISTGTWSLAMRRPRAAAAAQIAALDERRDCLVNVSVAGAPIPTARFMSGREIELLTPDNARRLDHGADQSQLFAAVSSVVRAQCRVLPAVAAGIGPYPNARHRWDSELGDSLLRRAAVGLYAAKPLAIRLDGCRAAWREEAERLQLAA